MASIFGRGAAGQADGDGAGAAAAAQAPRPERLPKSLEEAPRYDKAKKDQYPYEDWKKGFQKWCRSARRAGLSEATLADTLFFQQDVATRKNSLQMPESAQENVDAILAKLDEARAAPDDDFGYKSYRDFRDHRRKGGDVEEFLNEHDTKGNVFEVSGRGQLHLSVLISASWLHLKF